MRLGPEDVLALVALAMITAGVWAMYGPASAAIVLGVVLLGIVLAPYLSGRK